MPWVESPFFEEILEKKNLNEEQTRIVKEYHQNGYVVISGLLPQSIIDQAKDDSETKGFNPDFEIRTQRDETRVQDFWQKSPAVKDIACYPEILKMLNLLYDRQAVPFQTLNFKVGTQQKAHSDTIHFSSLPARFMCGVWVALEDITEENGPVFYCPGSQRLPEYNFSHIQTLSKVTSYQDYPEYEAFMENVVKVNSFPMKKFLAKKGDVLIWSSNIIHGGSPVTKVGSTRWSQVTHYFFEDCYYYTPMLSNMVTNELYLRQKLVNIKTGEKVMQSYNRQKLKQVVSAKNLFILNDNIKRIFKALKFFIR